ncbi:MAG TPA: Spy/CpxP family protein refolding chaperone [Nevskiaceae bacterium]
METTVHKYWMTALAAGAALGMALPALASEPAAATPAPQMLAQNMPMQGSQQNMPLNGPHHRGERWHGEHGRMHNWPFAHALKKVHLTEAQKKAVREQLRTAETNIREKMKALHEDRVAFYTTVPGSPEYIPNYEKYARDAAAAVQTRIQETATAHTNIYNLLTGSQQEQFRKDLAEQAQWAHDHPWGRRGEMRRHGHRGGAMQGAPMNQQ